MKYILLILCIALVGCEKSDLNRELMVANKYEQAGMIDEAEKYYQELILSEDDVLKENNWIIKDKLLDLYLDTNQIDKADKYMALANFSNTKEVKYNILLINSSAVAEALYNEKKYVRAMFHFERAAEYKEHLGRENNVGCNIEAVSLLFKAYDSAIKANITSEATSLRIKALEILNYKICSDNEEAVRFRYLLNA
jgi:hypothetical protein